MNFNTNRPMTEAQLAALYARNPAETDSQLFLANPRAHSWVQGQAQRMGIDDPEAHFATLQTQQAMRTAPSMFQSLANREAGRFGANTLPGQLQARDQTWDAIAATQAAEAAKLATLQRAQALDRTPLQSLGQGEQSMVDGQPLWKAAGFNSPAALDMSKRMAGVAEGRQFNTGNQMDNDTLYRDPRFRALMERYPDKAAHVFEAVTGNQLTKHSEAVLARDKDQNRFGMDTVQDWTRSGRAQWNTADNKWKMRQLVPDPTNPGRLIVGDGYEDLDPFQSEMFSKYGPQVAPLLAERAAIVSKSQQSTPGANPITSSVTAQTPSDPLQPYAASQPGYHLGNALQAVPSWLSRANDVRSDIVQDNQALGQNVLKGAANLFGGNWAASPYLNADPNDVGVAAPQHARAQLANNPQFRDKLMRLDPESRRRIIQRLQGL